MPSWPLQDAKARLSELVDTTLKKGPQIITRRGVETVVMVPIEEWKRLQANVKPTLKELLLRDGPRFDMVLPNRKKSGVRPRPVKFE